MFIRYDNAFIYERVFIIDPKNTFSSVRRVRLEEAGVEVESVSSSAEELESKLADSIS